MNPDTALAGLRDIHLPEAISVWPPALGWWVLAALLALCAVALLVARSLRRRSVKRAALRELASATREFERNGDRRDLAAALSGLLRRVALARFPRLEVASLHGCERLESLAGPGGRTAFPADVLNGLEATLYDPSETPAERETGSWISATRDWIRRTA